MLFQFDQVQFSIDVVTDDIKHIEFLKDVYENIQLSSVGYIVNSFFREFAHKKFTGKVVTRWHSCDEITFHFKDGKFHTNNRNHAAIHSKTIKVFVKNGFLRTRDHGPCCSICLINSSSVYEAFYIDEEKEYDVEDFLIGTIYVKGTSSHVEGNIFNYFRDYQPKHGARYIKRGKYKIYHDFGSPKLSVEIEKYLDDNNLKYDDVPKSDWELIMFQCNIMVK